LLHERLVDNEVFTVFSAVSQQIRIEEILIRFCRALELLSQVWVHLTPDIIEVECFTVVSDVAHGFSLLVAHKSSLRVTRLNPRVLSV
jgi:hypothetical protein